MGDLKVSTVETAFMCILYVILGIVSIMCNILNLTVWSSSHELRRKCLYLMALDACEIINGISYILVGTGRGMGLIYGFLTDSITIRQCYFDKYWPHSLILGTELPSFCIVLIAAERLCAVLRPASYKRIFMGKYKLVILSIVPFAGTVSLIVAGVSTMGSDGDSVVNTQHCAIINSSAIWYSTFHFVFIVMAYVVSFISLLIVWRISSKFSQKKFGGDNRIGTMLVITGSSIFLIGTESTVMLFIRYNVTSFSDIVVAITYAMPGFLSIFNTVINLLLRHEFRNQFFLLFRLRVPSYTRQNSVWINSSKTCVNMARTKFTQSEKRLVF